MKKIFSLMLIALMLSVGGAVMNTYAAQSHHSQQVASANKTISGQIARIKNNSLTLKDSAGKYHMVSVTDPTMLQGLKSGDEVTVNYTNGKVTSIKKVEGYSHSTSTQQQ